MPASGIHVDSRTLGHECGYMTKWFYEKGWVLFWVCWNSWGIRRYSIWCDQKVWGITSRFYLGVTLCWFWWSLAIVSLPYRLGLSVARIISCCICKTNGWKQMRDDYWFVHYGRVGVCWHLGHFGLAQIGAHVGSPLRQNPNTRVPKRYNIRLHYSDKSWGEFTQNSHHPLFH